MIGVGVAFQIQEDQIAGLHEFVGRQISVLLFQTLNPAFHGASGDELIHLGILSTEAGKVGAPVGSIGVAAAGVGIAVVVLTVAVFINDEISLVRGVVHLRPGNGGQVHQPVAGELHGGNAVFPNGFILGGILRSSYIIIGRNSRFLRIAHGDGYGVIAVGIGLELQRNRGALGSQLGGVNVRAILIHSEDHRVGRNAAFPQSGHSDRLLVDDQIAVVVHNGHEQLGRSLGFLSRSFRLLSRSFRLLSGSFRLLGGSFRLLSRSFRLLGRSFRLLSGSFGLLGRSFGLFSRSFGLLGGSFGLLGRSFRLLGRSFRLLGGSFGLLGRSFRLLGGSGRLLSGSGRLLSGSGRLLSGSFGFRLGLGFRFRFGFRFGNRFRFGSRFRFLSRSFRFRSGFFYILLAFNLGGQSMSVYVHAFGHGHHTKQVHDDQQHGYETPQGRV